MATQNFINECKKMANANRLGRFELQMYDRFEKELKGNTLQDSYSGKNLLINIRNEGYTVTSNGITFKVNADKSITISGTATGVASMSLNTSVPVTLSAGTYTLSKGETSNVQIAIWYDSASVFTSMQGSLNTIQKTISEDTTFNKWRTLVVVYEGVTINTTIYPMLEKGNVKTSYEPYVGGVPSPNPDYPQEIQSVTGLQNVEVCGKNLIKNTNTNSGDGNYWQNFSTFDEATGTLTRSTTATTESYITHRLNGLKSNTKYTISCLAKSNGNVRDMDIYCFNKNTQGIKSKQHISLTTNFQKYTYTFTTESDVDYSENASIRFDNNGSTQSGTEAILTIKDVMLVEGEDTDFEPYKCNTYEVNLGKNLLDESKGRLGTFNGLTISYSNGEILLNGTATALVDFYVATKVSSPTYNEDLINYMNNNIGAYTLSNNLGFENYFRIGGSYLQNTGTTTSTNKVDLIFVRIPVGTYNNQVLNIQLEKGSKATSYSEYFTPIELNKIGDYQDSIKKSSGKNLFDTSNAESRTHNGITFTLNNDGSIKANGTASSLAFMLVLSQEQSPLYKAGNYAFNLSNEMPNNCYVRFEFYDSNNTMILRKDITTNGTATLLQDSYLKVSYVIASGTVLNNFVNYIQIEQGSTITSYEPYGKVWYVEKQIGKVVLNGSENWTNFTTVSGSSNTMSQIDLPMQFLNRNGYTDRFPVIPNYSATEHFVIAGGLTHLYVHILNSRLSTLDVTGFKSWLASNNVEFIYILSTPTYTEITNTELIEQLESIELLKGTNNITITSENLPVIFDYSFWNGDTEVDEDDRFLEVNQSNYLTSIELKDSCCVNNNILGTTYTKSAEVELLDLPVGTKLESQIITPEIGVKYNDDTTEYETFDDYVIESLNDEQTASNTKFTAMNGGTLLDKEYECSLSFENGQTHTINEFYQDACSQIGITPIDSTFDNSEIVMTGNPFTNKETIRTVISEVEKTSCSIARFDWKNKTISLTWLSDQIDYEFNTSDYSTLEGSLTQYGPLNTIIIANSQLDGENVVMTDEESVAEYGEHQIIIDSPYFLYTEDLRTQAIQAIYDKLDGLTYYDLKLTTPYGKPFLNIGDKIRINTNENQVLDTYVLSHTFKYDGTFSSIIESPALTQEEQTIKNEFKGNSVREKLRRTELMVDKTTGDITAITDRVTTVENEFGDVYSKEEVNTLVQNSATGITNTFVNSGGNNLLRNTGLWFEDRSTIEYMYPSSSLYPSDNLFMSADPHWEYWKGNAKKVKEDKAANMSGILLQTGYLEQQQQVRNGTYTLSFKYRKLIELATVNVQINDRYIDLTNIEDTEIIEVGEITAQNISIKIFSDTDDSCIIYDLMLNAGSEKAEYSQHQNETTTDTVNISKGITIQSSDTNTTFKANSDGIRVYNSRDMDTPITEYTDTGMDTNRIKVKEEAEIIQVLWKNVGNNTWISRL